MICKRIIGLRPLTNPPSSCVGDNSLTVGKGLLFASSQLAAVDIQIWLQRWISARDSGKAAVGYGEHIDTGFAISEKSDSAGIPGSDAVVGHCSFRKSFGKPRRRWVAGHTSAFTQETQHEFTEIGIQAMKGSFSTMIISGIFAGWLIALMVWLLPFAESARIWVIIFLSYLVGIGHFSHVVAGSVQTFYWPQLGRVPGVLF